MLATKSCLFTCAGLVALLTGAPPPAPLGAQSAPPHIKIAYWNIQSGFGQSGLPGTSCAFTEGANCTDASQPLNAWGMHVVQDTLAAAVKNDPAVVALGLSEAWACGTATAVQQFLGWKGRTSTRGGIGLVARYGFAGPEEWIQLDTSSNLNPADTKYALRIPICLDGTCSRSLLTYTTHAFADGLNDAAGHLATRVQFAQMVEFMSTRSQGQPHVLVGDLNVWEGTSVVCGQSPRGEAIEMLRAAGYLDAWPSVHAREAGFTGMWNRATCGTPEGSLWKRIDYGWSKRLNPLSMSRFGMVQPGMCAPSDHAGIVIDYGLEDANAPAPTVSIEAPFEDAAVSGAVNVDIRVSAASPIVRVELLVDRQVVATLAAAPYVYRWDATSVPNGPHVLEAAATNAAGQRSVSPSLSIEVANPSAADDEVVLRAGAAAITGTAWTLVSDPTAAGGRRLQNANAGAPNRATAQPTPSQYVEFAFSARAGRPYRLWLRGKATDDLPVNDSVHVQFSGSVDAAGKPLFRIGSQSSTTVHLEDCGGCGLAGWGWQDNASARDVLGPPLFFATTGPQRLRIHAKEDGLGIDQVVLSAVTYRYGPPGAAQNDDTNVPIPGGASSDSPPSVAITAPRTGTTAAAPGLFRVAATASDSDGIVQRVEFFDGPKLLGIAYRQPFEITWTDVAAGNHVLTARATDSTGNSSVSGAINIVVSSSPEPPDDPPPPPPPSAGDEIVLHVASAAQVTGGWVVTSDATAASGARLQSPNAGAAKLTQALANPTLAFEVPFTAEAGKAYRIWVRGKALGDSYNNDSVFVQFDGSVDAAGRALWRSGTTAATAIVLEDCGGCGVGGWGWADNGYGLNVLGPVVYFARTGTQRLRIQTREDGLGIDQVVLSAVKYKSAAPGAAKNDTTILAPGTGGSAPNVPPTISLTVPPGNRQAPAAVLLQATASDRDGTVTAVEFFVGTTLIARTTASPYQATWSASAAGTYSVRAIAIDNAGARNSSSGVSVTITAPPDPPPPGTATEVVLHVAADAQIVQGWSVIADSTAAGGRRLQNPNAGAAKLTTALAQPTQAFEMTFDAEAGRPYRIWMRGRALADSYNNDSAYLQFDGSVNASGGAMWRIGTTSATSIVLEDCGGCGVNGWGWADNGYGPNVLGPVVYFVRSGPQRIRVQMREDGLGIDQVVISAGTYLTARPGLTKNDTTIIRR